MASLSRQPGRARPPAGPARDAAMTRKRRRLIALSLGLLALGAATALVLAAFNDNLVFFYSPSDLAAKGVIPERRIRIGGLVVEHSLVSESDGPSIAFRVADNTA